MLAGTLSSSSPHYEESALCFTNWERAQVELAVVRLQRAQHDTAAAEELLLRQLTHRERLRSTVLWLRRAHVAMHRLHLRLVNRKDLVTAVSAGGNELPETSSPSSQGKKTCPSTCTDSVETCVIALNSVYGPEAKQLLLRNACAAVKKSIALEDFTAREERRIRAQRSLFDCEERTRMLSKKTAAVRVKCSTVEQEAFKKRQSLFELAEWLNRRRPLRNGNYVDADTGNAVLSRIQSEIRQGNVSFALQLHETLSTS